MCRSIKTLFNFDPPATEEEIHEASLQFVRKISGFQEPSQVNKKEFNRAVVQISKDARKLIDSLVTASKSRNRDIEVQRARVKSVKRFGTKKLD